jgi:hypothetical protein
MITGFEIAMVQSPTAYRMGPLNGPYALVAQKQSSQGFRDWHPEKGLLLANPEVEPAQWAVTKQGWTLYQPQSRGAWTSGQTGPNAVMLATTDRVFTVFPPESFESHLAVVGTKVPSVRGRRAGPSWRSSHRAIPPMNPRHPYYRNPRSRRSPI